MSGREARSMTSHLEKIGIFIRRSSVDGMLGFCVINEHREFRGVITKRIISSGFEIEVSHLVNLGRHIQLEERLNQRTEPSARTDNQFLAFDRESLITTALAYLPTQFGCPHDLVSLDEGEFH